MQLTRQELEASRLAPATLELAVGQVRNNGYVVFERGTSAIVQAAHAALRDRNIEPLGRYGRWEYSSMGQVMRDGFAVGDRQCAKAEEPVSEAAAAAR